MRAPRIAFTRMSAFVTANTQFRTRRLYAVNPAEAAVCPRKSQRDTPSLVPSRHCLRTWRARVARRIAELSQPTSSTTRVRWTRGCSSPWSGRIVRGGRGRWAGRRSWFA
jgi:hypothetical protein